MNCREMSLKFRKKKQRYPEMKFRKPMIMPQRNLLPRAFRLLEKCWISLAMRILREDLWTVWCLLTVKPGGRPSISLSRTRKRS